VRIQTEERPGQTAVSSDGSETILEDETAEMTDNEAPAAELDVPPAAVKNTHEPAKIKPKNGHAVLDYVPEKDIPKEFANLKKVFKNNISKVSKVR